MTLRQRDRNRACLGGILSEVVNSKAVSVVRELQACYEKHVSGKRQNRLHDGERL